MDQTAQAGTKKPSAKRTSLPPWSKSIMGTKSTTPTAASTPNSNPNFKPIMPNSQNHQPPSSSAPPAPASITSDIAPTSKPVEAPAPTRAPTGQGTQSLIVSAAPQQQKGLVWKPPVTGMAERQSIRQLQLEWEASKRAAALASGSASPAAAPLGRESGSPAVQNGKEGSPAGSQPRQSPAAAESPVPLPSYATSQKRPAAEISSSEAPNPAQSAPPPKRQQTQEIMPGPEMVYITLLKKHMCTIPHCGNRLFCESQDEHGQWRRIRGLIVPKGYSLLDPNVFPVARWACPVRECRRRLDGLQALAAHMSACHNGRAFNDNQDGTISDVSQYNYAHGPERYKPPVVIGQLMLPVTAPAPVAPTLTTGNEVRVRQKQVKKVRDALVTEHAKPIESVEPVELVEPARHNTPQAGPDRAPPAIQYTPQAGPDLSQPAPPTHPQAGADHVQPSLRNTPQAGPNHTQPALQNNPPPGVDLSQPALQPHPQAGADLPRPALQSNPSAGTDHAQPAHQPHPQAGADRAQTSLQNTPQASADRPRPALQSNPSAGTDHAQTAFQDTPQTSADRAEPTFPTILQAGADPSDPVQYLNGFLSVKQREITREDVRFMAQLPRLRELPNSWLEYHQSEELDNDHYACALAYVVGESVTDESKCRHKERQPDLSRYRLSDECIRLPPSMTFSAKQIFSPTRTCVGCKYWGHLQRRPNPCEWNPANASKVKALEKSRPEPNRASSPVPSEDTEDDLPAFGTTIEREQRPLRAKKPSPAARSSPDTEQEDEGPDMEGWEFAPGKVLDESRKETVAFSTSYLTSALPITIADDIGFNRIRLAPGGTHRWPAKNGQLRYCEVITGKVEVRVDEQSISIGAGGLFVIRPGKSCRASNRRYAEAVLSCHTNSDYSYI